MMKVMYLLIASFTLCVSVSAQSELIYKSQAWSSKNGGTFQNGTKLSPSKVREVMSGNSEALKSYNSGRALLITGCVVAYPCAAMLGWDLGTRTGGGKGNGTLLTVGATGTVVGIIMGFCGEGKMKKSVQLYNSKMSNNTVSYQVNFGFTQTGVGLNMRF